MVCKLFIALCVQVAILWRQSEAAYAIPEITVNLDLLPEYRFVPALKLVLTKYGFDYSFKPFFTDFQWVTDQLPKGALAKIGQAVNIHFNEYYRELQGLANEFANDGHPEVDVNFLCAWVYIHELPHAKFSTADSIPHTFLPDITEQPQECTGVLTADANGYIFHGRNMDKGVKSVKNLTLKITYTRDSKVVAVATDYYWFNVGFVTGFKSGVASLSENWRKLYKDQEGNKLLYDIYNGAVPQVWMFREALINRNWNYQQIFDYFNTTYACAPFYVLIAGAAPWEGAILSRDPQTQPPTYYMKQNATEGWYLVQTNTDRWIPNPSSDTRRVIAENTLQKMGQAQGSVADGVLKVMQTSGIKGGSTIYTNVMSPHLSYEADYGQN